MSAIYLVSYVINCFSDEERVNVFATSDESLAKRYVGRANVLHTKRLELWRYRRDVAAQKAIKDKRLGFPYDMADWSRLTVEEKLTMAHYQHLKAHNDKVFECNPVKFIFGGVLVAKKKIKKS